MGLQTFQWFRRLSSFSYGHDGQNRLQQTPGSPFSWGLLTAHISPTPSAFVAFFWTILFNLLKQQTRHDIKRVCASIKLDQSASERKWKGHRKEHTKNKNSLIKRKKRNRNQAHNEAGRTRSKNPCHMDEGRYRNGYQSNIKVSTFNKLSFTVNHPRVIKRRETKGSGRKKK